MEVTAVIEGLRKLKEPCEVTIYTDSAYTMNAFDQGWLEDWQKQVQIDKYKIYKKLGNNLISNAFVAAHHVFMALKNKGVIDGIKYCKDKLK
jgi:ribonuclease HI